MSDLICRKSMMRCLTPGMCAPHGGCPERVPTPPLPADSASVINALASLLKRFVDGEHDLEEDQNERHHYHGEAHLLLRRLGGEFPDYSLVPNEALHAQHTELQALRHALSECTALLEGEILQKYHGQKPEDMHPVTRRSYDRDMVDVEAFNVLSRRGK
jgi:hypothetical protein